MPSTPAWGWKSALELVARAAARYIVRGQLWDRSIIPTTFRHVIDAIRRGARRTHVLSGRIPPSWLLGGRIHRVARHL